MIFLKSMFAAILIQFGGVLIFYWSLSPELTLVNASSITMIVFNNQLQYSTPLLGLYIWYTRYRNRETVKKLNRYIKRDRDEAETLSKLAATLGKIKDN